MPRLTATGPAAASWADWAGDHPEWWALGLSAGAWCGLLWRHAADPGGALCHTGPAAGFADAIGASWRSGALTGMLLGCVLMVIAMVPPMAVPLVRHVAARSFAVRRHRAVAGFLAGITGVWLLAAGAALIVLAGQPWVSAESHAAVGLGFLLAAGWQFAPLKRRALLRCHRTVPLASAGWRADRDCLLFGAGYAGGCVGSCWAMMLAAVLAGHDPLVSLCVQGVALAERQARAPWVTGSAVVLLACGGLMLVSGLG